ncbi:insulinase family protein (plasmid) [Massilia forsythiae]|uniref:Insulinase family protein n=1 Tax=Massilia forsythiae TaxID=2728020 RepID=A0A7Z2W248_9BURK|nr:M16 family metallopeptidase [Massilia forsythiae]QJE03647.1 insulinase family protein [Massilia forsythiae]
MPVRLRNALFAAIFASSLPVHAALDLQAPVPIGSQVKVGKLANGLTYYIQRNGKPAHRVELRLVVKAGSVLEDDDQQGLAHMVEHLAFNGSTHFKKQELVSYLQSIGVKFGADLNAFTSFDETVYMLPVPTDSKENIDTAFTVLEDWAHGVTLKDEDIDKERPIVLEEARVHKNAQERAFKALLPQQFNGSRYARRLPIGQEETIRHARPEALRRFYRDWYRPNLMALVVVGDIDPAEAESLIKAHFSSLTNPAQERPRTYAAIAARTTDDAFVFADNDIPANSLNLYYPVRSEADPGTYGSFRTKTVDKLFSVLLNMRLVQRTQQENPPFIGAWGGEMQLMGRNKQFLLGAQLGAGGAKPALAALQEEQQRIRQSGFTTAELERSRKVVLKTYEQAYNQRGTTDSAQYATEYLQHFLIGGTIPGIEAEYRLVQDILPTIGVADVNAAAAKAFPADAAKLIAFVGETRSAPAPTVPQLLAEAASAATGKATFANRDEQVLGSRLMDRPAKPGVIVAETRDQRLGLTRLTLSNGVKVILKPSNFRKDQVLLGAQRYGGRTLFDASDVLGAKFAGAAVRSMGIKNYRPFDLQKILAGRNADVFAGINRYTDDIAGGSGSDPDDLETMFQMVSLRFAGARRDETMYKNFIDNVTEATRAAAATPEGRFEDAITDALYAGHAYEERTPTSREIARISLDRTLAMDGQRFASAKGLTFVIVGDFEIDAIKPLVGAYLGTLPVTDVATDYRDVGLRPSRGVVRKTLAAGKDPKSVVALTFSGPADWSPAEALRMDALKEVLNLRVNSVLREKLGLIYGGQFNASLQRIPYQHYEIATRLTTGPDNIEQLTTALFAEIDKLRADGSSQAELDKVKANWRQGYRQWQQENTYWLQNLQASLLDGTDPARLLTILDEVDKLTVADVRRTAQRFLDKENYVEVVLTPEAAPHTSATGQP